MTPINPSTRPLAPELPAARLPLCTAALALGVFGTLTVAFTYPLAFHLTDAVEDGQDALLNVWIMAWDLHGLLTNPLDLFNANIFYPFARTLAYSEINFSQALLAAPFTVASGNPVLGYNVALLLTFVLSGWGAFLLARRWTGSTVGAYAAGILFAFNAYKMSNLAQIQLVSLHWLPFALLGLDALLTPAAPTRRLRPVVLATALFLALQALASFYYAFFMAIAAGLFLVCRWASDRSAFNRTTLASLLASALLAGAVVIPFALPYFQVQQEMGFQRALAESEPFSASLALYAQALPANVLYGGWLAPRDPVVIGGYPLDALFPGLAVLLLAAIGLRQSWRAQPFVVILTVTAFILSLGPVLYLAPGQPLATAVPLPYAWLYNLVPGFASMRAPERFSALVFLGLAILAAYGIAALRQRAGRVLPAAAVALVALVALECLTLPAAGVFPVLTGDAVPPVYRWLAQQPRTTILELPLGDRDAVRTLRYQYFSTYHWQRTPDGYSGFIPPQHGEMVYEMSSFPSDRSLALLRGYGTDYVVVHTADMPAPPTWPGLQLVQTFGADRVYLVTPATTRPRAALSAYLPTSAAPGADTAAYLILRTLDTVPLVILPNHRLEVQVSWPDQRITAQVGVPIITTGASVVPVRLRAPATLPQILNLTMNDPLAGSLTVTGTVASIASSAGQPFPVPVRLLGAATDRLAYQPGQIMHLTLRWQALGKIDAYYSVFARVIDSAGRIVARWDGEPQGGRRPTLLWAPGEVITDTIGLPLPFDSSPGVYRVEAGLYRARDLAPALTLDTAGVPVADPLVARVKVPLPIVTGRPANPVGAVLGDRVSLLGYDLAQAGRAVTVTLYWQATAPLATDYSVFVHALGGDGKPVTQSDGQPAGGAYPTGLWSPGEVVRDQRELSLPLGDYRLVAGMYDLATMARLPVPGGDAVLLGTIRVQP